MRRASEHDDLRAYGEIDEAIRDLVWLVWDRWHPKNPETQGQAPEAVYAGLIDVRDLAHELEALWVRLGNTDLGLARLVPERDRRQAALPGGEEHPALACGVAPERAALRELARRLDDGAADGDDRGPVEDPEADDEPVRDDGVLGDDEDAREHDLELQLDRHLDPPGLSRDAFSDPYADEDAARDDDFRFPDTDDPER